MLLNCKTLLGAALIAAVAALVAGSKTTLAADCALANHIRSANTNTAVGGCPAGTSHDVITISEDIILTEQLPAIRGTITIEGGGHTISGAGKFRIFDVSGGNLTVRDATLANAKPTTAARSGREMARELSYRMSRFGIIRRDPALQLDHMTMASSLAYVTAISATIPPAMAAR